jgi:phosphatidylglycerophosphatase A
VKSVAVLIATGLGAGYLKPAPGTWGSVVGFAYFMVLLRLPLALAVTLAIAVIAVSIWSSAETARIFARKDPSEVVIDEIAAVPLAAWPLAQLSHASWLLWLGVFVVWRIADIIKPFPARQLEALPGGWGIVTDDLMSATYVGLVLWGAIRLGWVS